MPQHCTQCRFLSDVSWPRVKLRFRPSSRDKPVCPMWHQGNVCVVGGLAPEVEHESPGRWGLAEGLWVKKGAEDGGGSTGHGSSAEYANAFRSLLTREHARVWSEGCCFLIFKKNNREPQNQWPSPAPCVCGWF